MNNELHMKTNIKRTSDFSFFLFQYFSFYNYYRRVCKRKKPQRKTMFRTHLTNNKAPRMKSVQRDEKKGN